MTANTTFSQSPGKCKSLTTRTAICTSNTITTNTSNHGQQHTRETAFYRHVWSHQKHNLRYWALQWFEPRASGGRMVDTRWILGVQAKFHGHCKVDDEGKWTYWGDGRYLLSRTRYVVGGQRLWKPLTKDTGIRLAFLKAYTWFFLFNSKNVGPKQDHELVLGPVPKPSGPFWTSRQFS